MAYPTSNTYNDYHNELVDLVINKNSRLYTAYFNLKVNDIATLRLSDTIYIDGIEYIINKVQDFNANGRQLTKVELTAL